MRVFEKILCPVDFSENSARAIQWTDYLASRFQSEVVIMHALEIPGSSDPFVYDVEEARSRAERTMVDFLAPLTVKYERVLCSGDATREIGKRAERTDSTVIVMGTHGLTGIAHKLVGSTAEAVIRNSRNPVITISPKCVVPPSHEKKRILVPVQRIEGPPPGSTMLKRIIRETGTLVTVMHVVDYKEPMYQVKSEVLPFNATTLEAEQSKNALRIVGEEMMGAGEPLETVVDFGDVPEGILKEAAGMKYDYILMGAKKERFLSRFVDSIIYNVIRQAPVPVIAIKTV